MGRGVNGPCRCVQNQEIVGLEWHRVHVSVQPGRDAKKAIVVVVCVDVVHNVPAIGVKDDHGARCMWGKVHSPRRLCRGTCVTRVHTGLTQVHRVDCICRRVNDERCLGDERRAIHFAIGGLDCPNPAAEVAD